MKSLLIVTMITMSFLALGDEIECYNHDIAMGAIEYCTQGTAWCINVDDVFFCKEDKESN